MHNFQPKIILDSEPSRVGGIPHQRKGGRGHVCNGYAVDPGLPGTQEYPAHRPVYADRGQALRGVMGLTSLRLVSAGLTP